MDAEMIFVMLVDFTVLPAVLYVLLRFGLPIWRLEAFTLRRLVVRFNRKTRKVYLLRPPHLGGVAEYDWDKTEAGVPEVENAADAAGAAGGFLLLALGNR